jgi:hypothetical protein
MITVLLTDGSSQDFKSAQLALEFVDRTGLDTILGFTGNDPSLEKLAYYAGEKKFQRATPEIKQLVTDTKTLEQHYKDRDEYGKTVISTKHDLRQRK